MSETTNLKLFKQDNPTTNTNNFDIEKTLNDNWDKLDENAGSTNEKIEKNAEGIAQNKKDVDEELTKIKKENSLMKSQIPTGTASGNNIHLEDSSNMDFEWKLRGWSRQETRSGKNLFDNTVEPQFISNAKKEIINTGERIILTAKTFSYAIFKVEKNIREYAGKTVRLKMDFSKSNANLNPKYGVLLGSSDYSNREVKGESTVSGYTITFNLPSELENEKEYLFVRLYATQNNEGNIENYVDYTKIILTIDNENMSYEAFGVSPSPEYPSKIENVGDNINILNKKVVDASNNLRGNALDTGRRLIANKDGTYTYGAFKLGGRELLGKTLGIHADIETTGGNPRISIFAGNSSSLTKSLLQVVLSASGTGYMTIPSNLNSELDTISAVLYVTTDASVVAGTYVDYTNLKVQVGSGEVVYSAYNCGSLGVTIGNENFGNAELLYSQMKNFSFTNVRKELVDNKNCIVFLNTQFRDAKGFKGLKFNYKKDTRYVIRGKFRIYDTSITSGSDLWIGAYDKDGKEIGHDNYQAKGSEWIQFSFLTDINSSFDHIDFSYGTTAYWCLDMDSLEIYEGTSVREVPKVQSQAIIFPLTEGQRLYNGSYLAKDGIHNIRTQIKLLSSGGNLFVSALGTYQVFGKTQKGIKQGSRLLSNYFKDYGSINAIKDAVGIANNNSTDRIYVSNGISTTLDEFKDWLNKCENAGRPVILEYELAEEEIIPYTTEQQAVIDKILYTYKNITNIAVSDKLASIDVTYKKDLETILNNQAKEYNERLSNIENLLNTTETSALLLDNLENDLEKEV